MPKRKSYKFTAQTFRLDHSKKYPDCILEVAICKNQNDLKFICELITSIGNYPETFENTDAVFISFVHPYGGISTPFGLVVLQIDSPPGTHVHEFFHAARYYFKKVGKKINEEKDEPFADLLGDLINGFYNACEAGGIKFG